MEMNTRESRFKAACVAEKWLLSTPGSEALSKEANYSRFAMKFVADPAEIMAWNSIVFPLFSF